MHAVADAAGAGSSTVLIATIIWGIIGLSIGLLIYFIPSLVAFKRQHCQKTPILLINIFVGWTFIGWVVALVWAASNSKNSNSNKLE